MTKQDLQEIKQALVEHIDQATQGLRAEMQRSMDALRVEMLQRMDEHAASLEESIRDSQTEMLKAFISYQEGQQIRMRGFESKDVEITERMAVLERRLQEIERRLLLNPPAA